jgi:hypothetical protein
MLGLIIAAGDQTRFKNDIPKCMMPYENSNVLIINIKTMLKYCREVTVITNFENYETICKCIFMEFQNNIPGIIHIERIKSGKGCGQAVFESLSKFTYVTEPIIFKWGDAIHDSIKYYQVFDNIYNGDLFIPCEFVTNPYTSLVCDGGVVQHILMKDEIQKNTVGWHDLSIFCMPDVSVILKAANFCMFDEPNIFLKSIMKMNIVVRMIKTILKSKSYNTMEEYNIVKDINEFHN